MDLDGNGTSDILSGSYSRMGQSMAGLFQVLWGQADGTFKKAETLNGSDGQPLIIPVEGAPGQGQDWIKNICTRPFAIDWDADGDLDLVVGNFPGTFYLFQGEGRGVIGPVPELIKSSDDEPLQIQGHHSDPFVIDWDGDGDLDLLSGSSLGSVQWAENHAGAGKAPELNAFQTLIEPSVRPGQGPFLREADLKGPMTATRIWVDDMNSDGKLDLLVGDKVHLTSPAGKLTVEQFNAKLAEWNRSYSEASAKLSRETDEAKRKAAMEVVRQLYSQRSEFMNEETTGFVWLYLQK